MRLMGELTMFAEKAIGIFCDPRVDCNRGGAVGVYRGLVGG